MALPKKLEANMKKFQEPNALPVFLKGGPADKVLFGITVACCGLGLIGILQMVYQMGFQKKKAS